MMAASACVPKVVRWKCCALTWDALQLLRGYQRPLAVPNCKIAFPTLCTIPQQCLFLLLFLFFSFVLKGCFVLRLLCRASQLWFACRGKSYFPDRTLWHVREILTTTIIPRLPLAILPSRISEFFFLRSPWAIGLISLYNNVVGLLYLFRIYL